MRQINFLIIFVFCLALVSFSLENTETVSIQLIEGLHVQAPLSLELIIAMGVGACLAWVFSTWMQFQRLLESRRESKEIRQRDDRIQALEQDVERYKHELQEQLRLPPAPTTDAEVVEAAEVYAERN